MGESRVPAEEERRSGDRAFDEIRSHRLGPDGIIEAVQRRTCTCFEANPETKVVEKLDTPDHAVALISFARDSARGVSRGAGERVR